MLVTTKRFKVSYYYYIETKEITKMKNAEKLFNELVEKFKVDAQKAVDEAIDSVHGDLVPYINEDTEHNAAYRARDIVRSIVSDNGRCELDGDSIQFDGWSIPMTSFDYDRFVDKLASVAGDKAKDLKIERLERQISEMMKVI